MDGEPVRPVPRINFEEAKDIFKRVEKEDAGFDYSKWIAD